ncbi:MULTISPECIES: putative glycolipid-binding domain-containing protein [Spirosoma]|uniref:Transcriptional regulator n=1 Tax=Spirosoma sordidisoli TaxID=2502893 RepID=A0A4Q2UPS4_9BACT|nr:MULTISPECIES: putative glycolipid-binding domain-containing protein [Spirosoma]RYC71713.1 transcriptional regulator [Spirosoma sordidisoli]
MQTTLLWAGLEHPSLEHCLITASATGFEIHSVIVGLADLGPYRVDYTITTDAYWQTTDCQLLMQLDTQTRQLHLRRDGNGNWLANNEKMTAWRGCTDVDISLTPFTNTLPINRLRLADGQAERIHVVYIDVLAQQTAAVHQRYTRRSATAYQYENVPNDFEATITVDGAGLVVDYPGLFTRHAQRQTG